jgi:hypothetical protein
MKISPFLNRFESKNIEPETMAKPTLKEIYTRNFTFLEMEHHFSVVRKGGQYVTEYIASKPECQVTVVFVNSKDMPPKVTIELQGETLKKLKSSGCFLTRLDIAEAAYYFNPSLKEPEWWENDLPPMPVEQQAACLRTYFGKILDGDYSEWPVIQEDLHNRWKKRRALYKENITDSGYEIIEQNGFKGLNFNNIPVLPAKYSSIIISNRDALEYTKKDFADEPEICSVDEVNYTIISVDGNVSLYFGKDIRLTGDFCRIIKLSYNFYLCQRLPDTFLLYNTLNLKLPVARFTVSGGITLSKYLSSLELTDPAVFVRLSETIRKYGNEYISQYRRYIGCQNLGWDVHDFVIATMEVVLHDDFSISEPVRVIKP